LIVLFETEKGNTRGAKEVLEKGRK
jgi:hypothetical protein